MLHRRVCQKCLKRECTPLPRSEEEAEVEEEASKTDDLEKDVSH